jgi:hypothetical protein
MAQMYGEENVQAFADIRDVDASVVLTGFEIQRSVKLEQELAAERDAKLRLVAQARVSDKERAELEALRAKAKQRQQKAARKKRAAASRPKKGKSR